MKWIKVSEQMPPDYETVLVTIVDRGKKWTGVQYRWNPEDKKWEWAYEAGSDYWEDAQETITHWAPYPEPALD